MAVRTDCVGVKIQNPVDHSVRWCLYFNVNRGPGLLRLQKWRVVGDGKTAREQIREYVSTSMLSRPEAEREDAVTPASIEPRGSHGFRSHSPMVEEGFLEDRAEWPSVTHSIIELAETMVSQSPSQSRSSSGGSEFNYADGYVSGEELSESEGEEIKSKEDAVDSKEGAIGPKNQRIESIENRTESKEKGINPKEEGREAKGAEVDDDNVQLMVKDAYSFKIFQPDDEERREPASILDLDFDYKEGHPPNANLHLMGNCSGDSSGFFMRTIDSWTMKLDGDQGLKIYVRDTKGLWIKLWNPSKEYEASVRDALIITKFLELAMKSKETNAKKCLDQLVNKIGARSSRGEIKTALRNYYPSIVKKFIRLERVPPFLQEAPILKNMEVLLQGKLVKEGNVTSVKRLLSSDELRQELKLKSGAELSLNPKRRRIVELSAEFGPGYEVQKHRKKVSEGIPSSNKRKRVVESDSENDSTSEDHIPLAQRCFHFPEKSHSSKSVSIDEQVDSIGNRDELDAEVESRKQDQDRDAPAGLPLSPALNKDDGSIRLDINDEEEQEFQDIADIYGGQNDGLGDIGDDDEELGDSAFCAICDDGGDLLFCDGPCMRSFHASKESASKSSESKCRSLGYTVEEVQEMGSWLCPNCVYSQHQCFICGRLGRSEGGGKEVFVCDVALCGRFYHPRCLAKWKSEEKFNGITDPGLFIRSVTEGVEGFFCPAHTCRKCGGPEEEGVDDNFMKLAKCRRCPKTYHKLHLPKKISFEGRDDEPIRAWEIGDEDKLVKQLVMYCLDHEIDERLSTPARNHLKWPKVSLSTESTRHKESLIVIQRWYSSLQKQYELPKSTILKRRPIQEDFRILPKVSSLKKGPLYEDGAKILPKSTSMKKRPINEDDAGFLPKSTLLRKGTLLHKNCTIFDRSYMKMPMKCKQGKSSGDSNAAAKDRRIPAQTFIAPGTPKKHVNLPRRSELQKIDIKTRPIARNVLTSREGRENRILEIMKRASQNITLEGVKERLVQPSCYSENPKKTFLRSGELASTLNAIRKASEMVKNGGSHEDAKRLCRRDLFIQMLKTEDMLRVHLAPILHGMRYTSFGRHFTHVDKLKEIVDRIHPYIDNGDMVVDFCCGANDFSILLHEKLSSVGKACHFMNFDIHIPKNQFCFTKGDWLKNNGRGFFEGKRLVMGLNPPFGVRAALANQFIRHALGFKPKLLVLIVPPETMNDSRDYARYKYPYDLVWEDKELLKGKAFYLPGSVDENNRENMAQWNIVTPPLYLWSSRDMIQKHREIAVRWKHIEGLKADTVELPNRRTPPIVESAGLMELFDNPINSGSTAMEWNSRDMIQEHKETIEGYKHIEDFKADAVELPNRRAPAPPLQAGEVARLKLPLDKQPNAGCLPKECDTSSSHHQHSSGTSSLAGGYSQNSLDGPGWEQFSGHTAQHEISNKRKAVGHVSASDMPLPILGPLLSKHIPVLPHQHLSFGSKYLNLDQKPQPRGQDQSNRRENDAQQGGDQSNPRGDKVQWGRGGHQTGYYDDDSSRIDLGNSGQVHPVKQVGNSWINKSHSCEQQWRNLATGPPPGISVTALPSYLNLPSNHGFRQHVAPNHTLSQLLQTPQPLRPGLPLLQPHPIPGSRLQPDGPVSAPRPGAYFRGQPPHFERRQGQYGVDEGTGGWLD